MFERKCLYCGKNFSTEIKIKIFCCYSCAIYAYNLKKQKILGKLTKEEINKRKELLNYYNDHK